MKIQQFQGGLATRLAPQFLQVNQGAEYTNVDNSTGVLTPIKSTTPTSISVGPYHTWFDHKQEWVSSTNKRDYVEYQRKLYWADRAGVPQVYDGANQFNLGIVPPPKLTDFTSHVVEAVVDIEVDATGAGVLPNVDTTYLFVNVDGVIQSNAFEVLVDKRKTSKKITVSSGRLGVTRKTVDTTPETRSVVFKNVSGFTYGSGGVEVYREYQGTFYLVGTLASSAATLTDNTLDISANAEFDFDRYANLQGVYQYQLTYYNSTTGTESGPGTFSDELDFSYGGSVTLNNLPVSSDPQVDKKRIYRVGGNLTTSTLVAEIDNATTSYYDLLDDDEVVGTLLPSSIAEQAPAGLAFLTEAYAMLFGAEGAKLRFTPIGEPESWPETYFLLFDADITGIAAVTNGILVFSKFQTYLVTGTGPTSLSNQLLSSDQGCIAVESVQVIRGTAIWASTDGLCSSSGNNVSVLSKDALGKLSLTPVDSTLYDEAYYLLEANGSILVFDFAYGSIFKRLNLGVTSLAVANDVLYGAKDGVLQQFFAGPPATVSYLSPRFIEGSVTEQKLYKKVHIYHDGDIMVDIWINNELVAQKQLTGTDSTTIKVPSEKQRGFFIQVGFTGTGTVHEFEYEASMSTSTK